MLRTKQNLSKQFVSSKSTSSTFSCSSPLLHLSKRTGLSHETHTKGLSPVTVQFNIFCSTLAVDAATGLPFPYHIQRLIDNESAKGKKEGSLSSLRMAPNQFKFWVDEKWATEIKKCELLKNTNNHNNNNTKKEEEKKSSTKTAAEKKSSSKKGKSDKKQQKEEESSSEESSSSSSTSCFASSVESSPWKYSESMTNSNSHSSSKISLLRHTSWFTSTEEQIKFLKEKQAKKEEETGTKTAPEDDINAKSPEEILHLLLRCRSGIPRCGQTGNFFTRQDLAFPLAVSAEVNDYKSPFWIKSTHPGLDAKNNFYPDKPAHLILKPDEKPTLASASLVVFPAKRLGFGKDAEKSALSAEYLRLRGSDEACGMNAISGVKLSRETSEDAMDFFESHPDFKNDGWVSFDQIMKLGLPLLSPVSGAGRGPKTSIVPDDLFDHGILVDILKNVEFYNQEQLERPGKLAMRRMPGAAPPLLNFSNNKK